jgi:hypothetical protein
MRDWAAKFGISRLACSLGIDRLTVHRWLRNAASPSIQNARQLIALSSIDPFGGAPLTWEDVYGPTRVESVEMRTPRRIPEWE